MRTVESEGDRLVAELLSDPEKFERRGLANELLKQFLRNYPTHRLRSLLRHENGRVVRSAIWIASELPSKAPELLTDIVLASSSADRYIRYYALDGIMLGAIAGQEG